MASLYIKDPRTAALANELAALLNRSKTEVVREALEKRKAELSKPLTGQAYLDWLEDWRKRTPLPGMKGPPADKAFYDWLSGDADL
ncbi:transcription factor [Sphingomonas gilva]|uniref:Transcription factor n=1 Tax=Sphingomonas gilva TaxID=2305907 RepID=A0A396RP32_9SPHN|nr:type II toxin-antitoxin system VapB family antitoxin [Sphingomonas gilva]RHW18284.1 transcription factor [Sphingomonas gilva]